MWGWEGPLIATYEDKGGGGTSTRGDGGRGGTIDLASESLKSYSFSISLEVDNYNYLLAML